VHIWNEFARKLGWNDRVAQFLAKVKAEDGTTDETADLFTAFELMDYREGRARNDRSRFRTEHARTPERSRKEE